jgi:hypothetical protein
MSLLRNILAVIVGVISGGIINMTLVMISGSIIPYPEGVDNTSMDGLREGIHLFEPEHFLFPFLAHALGTFAGALITALMAVKQKMKPAMVVGVFFLVGGIVNVFMLPSPAWFNAVDLIFAYIPMAWLGGKIASLSKR